MGKEVKNNLTILALVLIISCIVTGCGDLPKYSILLPQQADLSETEIFVIDHINELDCICSEFRNLSVRSVKKVSDSPDAWKMYDYELKEIGLITEEDTPYYDLARALSDNHISSIYWWGSDINMYTTEGQKGILKSDALPDEVEPPFDPSANRNDLTALKWKRTVNGDDITFIADHRLDFKSHWRQMYYRVDMKYVDNGFYVYDIQFKFPLYSYLVE